MPKNNNLINKVLVVGPLPPPDHGTSVPFKELVNFLCESPNLRLFIVNTQSGDKSNIRLQSIKILTLFLRFSLQVIRMIRFCDKK